MRIHYVHVEIAFFNIYKRAMYICNKIKLRNVRPCSGNDSRTCIFYSLAGLVIVCAARDST
jgi:hypothetical protein